MLKAIIATDLSDASMLAVESVIAGGQQVFGRVTLLHVVDLDLYTAGGSVPGILEFANKQLAREEARLLDCGIEASVRVEQGDTVETIERVFAEEQADIVVLTNLGKGAATGRAFGSTAEKVASRGAVPVLIERVSVEEGTSACRRAGEGPVTSRVLAAVGLDDASERLTHVAAFLPGTETLRLLHVPREQADAREAERALMELAGEVEPSVAVETAVVTGDPARTIVDEADGWGASLVAIASCAHGPAHRLVWGSVARSVAREARTSVLIVPHQPV